MINAASAPARGIETTAATAETSWSRQWPTALGDLIIAVLFGIGNLQGGGAASTPTGLRSGTPAPDFTLVTFDGRTVRLSDYRGRSVVAAAPPFVGCGR